MPREEIFPFRSEDKLYFPSRGKRKKLRNSRFKNDSATSFDTLSWRTKLQDSSLPISADYDSSFLDSQDEVIPRATSEIWNPTIDSSESSLDLSNKVASRTANVIQSFPGIGRKKIGKKFDRLKKFHRLKRFQTSSLITSLDKPKALEIEDEDVDEDGDVVSLLQNEKSYSWEQKRSGATIAGSALSNYGPFSDQSSHNPPAQLYSDLITVLSSQNSRALREPPLVHSLNETKPISMQKEKHHNFYKEKAIQEHARYSSHRINGDYKFQNFLERKNEENAAYIREERLRQEHLRYPFRYGGVRHFNPTDTEEVSKPIGEKQVYLESEPSQHLYYRENSKYGSRAAPTWQVPDSKQKEEKRVEFQKESMSEVYFDNSMRSSEGMSFDSNDHYTLSNIMEKKFLGFRSKALPQTHVRSSSFAGSWMNSDPAVREVASERSKNHPISRNAILDGSSIISRGRTSDEENSRLYYRTMKNFNAREARNLAYDNNINHSGMSPSFLRFGLAEGSTEGHPPAQSDKVQAFKTPPLARYNRHAKVPLYQHPLSARINGQTRNDALFPSNQRIYEKTRINLLDHGMNHFNPYASAKGGKILKYNPFMRPYEECLYEVFPSNNKDEALREYPGYAPTNSREKIQNRFTQKMDSDNQISQVNGQHYYEKKTQLAAANGKRFLPSHENLFSKVHLQQRYGFPKGSKPFVPLSKKPQMPDLFYNNMQSPIFDRRPSPTHRTTMNTEREPTPNIFDARQSVSPKECRNNKYVPSFQAALATSEDIQLRNAEELSIITDANENIIANSTTIRFSEREKQREILSNNANGYKMLTPISSKDEILADTAPRRESKVISLQPQRTSNYGKNKILPKEGSNFAKGTSGAERSLRIVPSSKAENDTSENFRPSTLEGKDYIDKAARDCKILIIQDKYDDSPIMRALTNMEKILLIGDLDSGTKRSISESSLGYASSDKSLRYRNESELKGKKDSSYAEVGITPNRRHPKNRECMYGLMYRTNDESLASGQSKLYPTSQMIVAPLSDRHQARNFKISQIRISSPRSDMLASAPSNVPIMKRLWESLGRREMLNNFEGRRFLPRFRKKKIPSTERKEEEVASKKQEDKIERLEANSIGCQINSKDFFKESNFAYKEEGESSNKHDTSSSEIEIKVVPKASPFKIPSPSPADVLKSSSKLAVKPKLPQTREAIIPINLSSERNQSPSSGGEGQFYIRSNLDEVGHAENIAKKVVQPLTPDKPMVLGSSSPLIKDTSIPETVPSTYSKQIEFSKVKGPERKMKPHSKSASAYKIYSDSEYPYCASSYFSDQKEVAGPSHVGQKRNSGKNPADAGGSPPEDSLIDSESSESSGISGGAKKSKTELRESLLRQVNAVSPSKDRKYHSKKGKFDSESVIDKSSRTERAKDKSQRGRRKRRPKETSSPRKQGDEESEVKFSKTTQGDSLTYVPGDKKKNGEDSKSKAKQDERNKRRAVTAGIISWEAANPHIRLRESKINNRKNNVVAAACLLPVMPIVHHVIQNPPPPVMTYVKPLPMRKKFCYYFCYPY